ncbi:MAG: T9SS type A sorting domain-containing protein [Gemmatimonadetes bacterium]|nr:T9SS type A sorting domain-containing protein [Gemmatimonadota bacterium]
MSRTNAFLRPALLVLAGIALLALGMRPAEAAPGDITVFAGPGTGQAGFSGDGSPVGTGTLFHLPHGVAVDGKNLYIADVNNQRIRKVDLITGIINTVVGTGIQGSLGDGGQAINAQLSLPYGVATDRQGNLYIGDVGNSRIRKVDLITGIITTVVGTGTQGSSGDGGQATVAEIDQPYGISFDRLGNLYFTNQGNSTIRKVDPTGIITTVVGDGTNGIVDGPLPGRLSGPFGVAVNAQGTLLYIADTGNNSLRKVDLVANTISTETILGGLSSPRGVVVDSQGDVYIGDYANNRVVKYDPTAGSFIAQYLMNSPTGVTLDGQGNLYSASHLGNQIVKVEAVSPIQGPISEWRADGNANDSVGANNGVEVNGVAFAPGRIGQAFSLDNNAYVSVPSAPDLNPTGSLTLAAWVKPTQDTYQPFIKKWGDSGAWANQRAYGLYMQAGRNLVFGISDAANQGNGSLHTFSSPPGVIAINAWNHIASVYDQSTGTRRIYVNGVEVAQRTDTPITITNSIADLGIGAWIQAPNTVNGNNAVRGDIDDVRIYGRALSESEVRDLVFFEIEATAGANGSISPSGKTTVDFNGGQIYNITPDSGYQIDDVLVDGASVGAVSSYTFSNVQSDHTIDVSFSHAGVTVTAPTVTATYNEALTLPITLSDATDIISAELFVEYDSALLTVFSPATSSTGTLSQGWSVQTNTELGAGTLKTLKIALATDQSSATGAQTLINLRFTVNDVRVPASSALALTHVLLNAGDPPNITVDGLVTLVGNDGSISSAPPTFIPREDLTVTVTDLDADLDGNPGSNTVSVTATNQTTGDVVNLTLNEDGTTAGTFSFVVPTEFGTAAIADNILQAQAGEIIEFSYSDALDAAGAGPTPRTTQSTAIGGTDGTVQITHATQPGDTIYLKVVDADLNTDPGATETAQVVVTSTNGESETVTLNEVDADDDVFFGSLASTAGAGAGTNDDGTINAQKVDVLTATYDDVVTAVGDQVDRSGTDTVVDPFGDADANGQVQAFDAAQVLLHSLSPFLNGLDSLSANVDLLAFDPVQGKITPYDASLVLQKRVGLISIFPVQTAPADNNPQPTASSSPKGVVATRLLTLEEGEGYVRLVADQRADLLSGDLLLTGVERVELAPELGGYLIASQSHGNSLRVVLAGAQGISGSGELLRLYGADLSRAQVRRAEFNDGRIEARVEISTALLAPVTTRLQGNYPNPFNPETTIHFDLAQAGQARLEVFDVLGQQVQTLVAGHLPAGSHRAVWSGLSESGRQVSSGVYFYRLQTVAYTQMRRMLLLK